ncbi:protein NPC2 homolog [Eurytemora carolleeae]|uniref:protein NPC2 homolog n=1 Tax=Eurytemora carolleeae TaxID=1294199 RepID=UPI000C771021|nr:protein NPC2 homolog [Eurytemora carolleeae]|eukprot:XP_023335349.1 protein NPC2 homolog [Eurytemora affinis]
MQLILKLAFVLCFGFCRGEVKFEDCGSSGTDIKFSCSEGCSGDILELTKGKTTSFNLGFKSGEDSATLTNNIVGILGGGVEMPYNNIMSTDFCSGLPAGSCPVKAGSYLEFTSNIEILPTYPTIPVTIKWEVKNAGSGNAVCILIKSKIV